MSYTRWRDEFMVATDLPLTTKRALLRAATTLKRLAEAQCNGAWPYDNGERKVIECPLCTILYDPSAIQGGPWAKKAALAKGDHEVRTACPDCRTEARVRQLLEGTSYQPYFQGDPRGAVLQLCPVGASYDDMHSGRARGVAVPTR